MASGEWFTVDGGYVLMHEPDPEGDGAVVFACTAGDRDNGVLLTTEECMRIGVWLLKQVLKRYADPVAMAITDTVTRAVPAAVVCVGYGRVHSNNTLACRECEPF